FETCQAHYQEQPISSLLSSVDPMIAVRYLRTFRPFDELNRPLYSTSSLYRNHPGQIPLEKHLAMAFYPKYGFGFGRSFAYRQATIIGSIFKVATAYQALMQNHHKNPKASYRDLNPLEITDKTFKVKNQIHVAQTKEGKPIPQLYKGGRIPRSAVSQIGKIDCIRALEKSSNPYFSLLAGDFLNDPEDLNRAAETFSFGTKTGIDLPGELPGKLPTDLATNKTGLYAMAIGQHSLVVTPLQTAVMLSILANQGKVPTPKMGALKVGTLPFRYPLDQPPLTLFPTQFKREIELPLSVRNILFAGMQRIVHQTTGDSLWSIARLFPDDRQKITDYVALKNQLIGKTATSEVYERLDLDPNRSGHLYKHTGFGGILFDRDISFHDIENNLNKPLSATPELVIVVYLRYGSFGKEAAPLAAQIAKKYRAIKTKMKHHQALFL
ncbi:MAG: hypothetical protein KDK65_07150, partial [Chlamydiia bacterium]|nr:hypothetical protein [Chlamydiia bacterium]